MKKLALHWQILIGMALGILLGFAAVKGGFGGFVTDWIKPFGTIFINLLKLIAIPLIIASLLKGISDLKDIAKLSNMGFRTLATYLVTTVIAITIGLVIVNTVKPGTRISEDTRSNLMSAYVTEAESKISQAKVQLEAGPLQPLVDIVPDNIFGAMTNNGNMLQVIFFVVIFGIAMILLDPKKVAPVKNFVDALNEIVMKLIDMVMLTAPIGVLALLAGLIVDSPSSDLFKALAWYSLCVLLGLGIMTFLFYPLLVRTIGRYNPKEFLQKITPAQLLAFSTSSSAATLPVTMERVNEHVGVDDDVTSFVLPIGATINMDGTSLYQAVAAVFIAQTFGIDLGFSDQINIVLTATLASIGSAAVPGAGMVMLVIVLGAIGVPEAGLALIFAVDRPLDMCRTVTNVTGDATVAVVIARMLGYEIKPHVKNIDDN